MTRDEAVKKAEECFLFNTPGQEWRFTPLRLVAALENLGVLKMDDPKTEYEMLAEAMGDGAWTKHAIMIAIGNAGLKVVRA